MTDENTTGSVQLKRLIPQTKSHGVFRNTFGLTADELLFVVVPPLATAWAGAELGLFSPGNHLVELLAFGGFLALAVRRTPYHLTPYTFTTKWLRFGLSRLRMPLVSAAARDIPGIADIYTHRPTGSDLDGEIGAAETPGGRVFAAVLAAPEYPEGDDRDGGDQTNMDLNEWAADAASFASEYDAALAKNDIDAQLHFAARLPQEADGDAPAVADIGQLSEVANDPSADAPDDARLYAGEAAEHTTQQVAQNGVMHRRLAVVVDVDTDAGSSHSRRLGGVRRAVGAALPFLRPDGETHDAQLDDLADRVEKAKEVAWTLGADPTVLDADGLGHLLRDYWLGDGSQDINVTEQTTTEERASLRADDAVRAAREEHVREDIPDTERTDGDESGFEKSSRNYGERFVDAARDAATHFGSARRTALWGPASFDERREYVEVGDMCASSLWVSSWPTTPGVGLLSSLATTPGVEFDVALHVGSTDRREKVDQLDDEMQTLSTAGWRQEQQGEGAKAGDATRSHAEKRALRDYAQEEEIEIAEVSATITVRADTPEQVAAARNSLQEVARRSGVTATPAHGDHRAALTSTAPMADDALNRTLRSRLGETISQILKVRIRLGVETRADMPTDTVGCIVPPLHAIRRDANGVGYGLARVRHPNSSRLSPAGILQVRRSELQAPHRYVFGASGSGKTYREMAQLYDELLRGELSQAVIIDIAENFEGLVEAFDGSRVVPGETLLNPFAISPGTGVGRDDKINLVTDLLMIYLMDNAPESRALELRPSLKTTVTKTYDRAGITDAPETHGRPSPVFDDWLDTLEAVDEDSSTVSLRDTESEREQWAEDVGYLLTRFSSFPEEYDYLCPDPEADDDPEGEVDVTDRVVLFDMSDYQDRTDAAKGMLATHILSHAFRTAKRAGPEELIGVVVDEAHDVFKDSQRAGRFEATVRAGRNHGLAFDFLSQAAEDFDADSAEVIAQQCPVTVASPLGEKAAPEDIKPLGFNDEQASAICGGLEAGESDRPFSEGMVNVEGDVYRTAFSTSPVMDAMIDYRRSDHGAWRDHVDRALLDGVDVPTASDRERAADDEGETRDENELEGVVA